MLKVKLSSCGNPDFPEQRNIESLSDPQMKALIALVEY